MKRLMKMLDSRPFITAAFLGALAWLVTYGLGYLFLLAIGVAR